MRKEHNKMLFKLSYVQAPDVSWKVMKVTELYVQSLSERWKYESTIKKKNSVVDPGCAIKLLFHLCEQRYEKSEITCPVISEIAMPQVVSSTAITRKCHYAR